MYQLRFIHLGITVLTTLLVASGCALETTPSVPALIDPPPATPVTKLFDSHVDVDSLPDVMESRKQINQRNYVAGVRALTRAVASYPNNAQLSTLLAQAYLDWGKDSITTEESALNSRSLAIDHFSSGLAVASSGELRTQLQTALSESIAYLRLEDIRQRLGSALEKGSVGDDLLNALETIPRDVDLLLARNPADPALRDLASATLLLGGQALLLHDDRKTIGQAQSFCARAAEIGAGDPASECIATAQHRLAPPTSVAKPTERPTSAAPTARPIPRLVIPDMRGADVGRARNYLRSNGFTGQIAVTEVNDPGQVSQMCRQGVLYTAPSAGARVPPNTSIRIFYRGSVNAPGLPDCNAQ